MVEYGVKGGATHGEGTGKHQRDAEGIDKQFDTGNEGDNGTAEEYRVENRRELLYGDNGAYP